ncbi:hypothetical protein XENTR_v10000690 [Xenopus tropicalis]|nr:hypothetical protein XENTR_v10000690 [Xenopus tropicalis]
MKPLRTHLDISVKMPIALDLFHEAASRIHGYNLQNTEMYFLLQAQAHILKHAQLTTYKKKRNGNLRLLVQLLNLQHPAFHLVRCKFRGYKLSKL